MSVLAVGTSEGRTHAQRRVDAVDDRRSTRAARRVQALAIVPAAAACLAVALASWAVYVFTGSQIAYVSLLVSTALLAFGLGVRRQSMASGLLLGLVAFVGPDLSGELGDGLSPTGSLRLLDLSLAAAAAGAGLGLLADRAFRRPQVGTLTIVVATVVLYAVGMWAARGMHVSAFLGGDLRLMGSAGAMWFVAVSCTVGGPRRVLWTIVALAPALCLKAGMIVATHAYAIGNYDRLQASSLLDGTAFRVILVGGDTLVTLTPAIALALAWQDPRRLPRASLAICGALSVVTMTFANTRTGVIIAAALLVLVVVVMLFKRTTRPSWKMFAVAGVVAVLAVAGLAAGGVASRLTKQDAPHVGLNFRADEINRFLDLGTNRVVLGQGLGGVLVGKSARGQLEEAGWAHELPVWIALKTGVFGLLAALLVVGIFSIAGWRSLSNTSGEQDVALAGVVLVFGVLAMSLTLGRAALIEGVMPLMFGASLLLPARGGSTDKESS